jgi:hypothetical protein
VVVVWRTQEPESRRVNYWEIIAANLSKAGWSRRDVSGVILADEKSLLLTHIAAKSGKRTRAVTNEYFVL